jgi:hypothetical protein
MRSESPPGPAASPLEISRTARAIQKTPVRTSSTMIVVPLAFPAREVAGALGRGTGRQSG